MLEKLQRIALALFPWRRFFWFGAVVCVIGFIYAVLTPDTGNLIARPALLVGIWMVLILSFAYGFRQVPPAVPKPWWRRWLRSIYRGGYWLLASLTLLASVGLIGLSMRLLLQVGQS